MIGFNSAHRVKYTLKHIYEDNHNLNSISGIMINNISIILSPYGLSPSDINALQPVIIQGSSEFKNGFKYEVCNRMNKNFGYYLDIKEVLNLKYFKLGIVNIKTGEIERENN
jgi:hypothetical protein